MEQNGYLFNLDLYPVTESQSKLSGLDVPLWTQNKALFIARYLKTFTYVTKHGTYIDAFAGPQHERSKESSWAAKLVLENEPKWLRNFYLFDEDSRQVEFLQSLREEHFRAFPNVSKTRRIKVIEGDCNVELPRFLEQCPIRDKEATFCLFDQRSTECAWETVKTVAKHKDRKGTNKIEIFYFFAQGWIDRAIKSWRKKAKERCVRWWGNDEVMEFLQLSSPERGFCFARRFKNELGYRYSYPYPIQKEGKNGATMFWMIHASDHERAPQLMTQAYNYVGAGRGYSDPANQSELDLGPTDREKQLSLGFK